jgi:hypothetical protein
VRVCVCVCVCVFTHTHTAPEAFPRRCSAAIHKPQDAFVTAIEAAPVAFSAPAEELSASAALAQDLAPSSASEEALTDLDKDARLPNVSSKVDDAAVLTLERAQVSKETRNAATET